MIYIGSPDGKYNFDHFKYKMPIFGKLIFSLDFSKFMKAVLINLESGASIKEALKNGKRVVDNSVMLSIVETSISNMEEGSSWIEPFKDSGLCSHISIEMLKSGTKNNLSERIEKLIEYLQTQTNSLLKKISKQQLRIMYVIASLVLVFVILAIIVPCIQLYMK